MTEPVILPSKVVANMLGMKTSTLRKWRQLGKGPRAYAHLGDTVVVYTRESVEQYLATIRREAEASEAFWRSVDDHCVRAQADSPGMRSLSATQRGA